MTEDELRGWKEISAFLRTSYRTAQRWEIELGMPVHRLASRRWGGVYALRSELTVWQQTAAGRWAAKQSSTEVVAQGAPGAQDHPPAPEGGGARRRVLVLSVGAALTLILAVTVFLALRPTPGASATPRPSSPTGSTTESETFRLRFTWPNGFATQVEIANGESATVLVKDYPPLQVWASRNPDGAVHVTVTEVSKGEAAKQAPAVIAKFDLQRGMRAEVVDGPSPFRLEWIQRAEATGEGRRPGTTR